MAIRTRRSTGFYRIALMAYNFHLNVPAHSTNTIIPLLLDLRIPPLTISLQIGFHMIIYCYFHNDLIIRVDLSSIIRI